MDDMLLQAVLRFRTEGAAALSSAQAEIAKAQESLKGLEGAQAGATAAAEKAAVAHTGLGGVLSGFGGTLKDLEKNWIGVGAAVAGAAAAFSALSFIKSAIDDTTKLGETVYTLGLQTGLGAVDASHFAFELEHVGLSADVGERALGIFAKAIGAHSKIAVGAMHELGVSATDAAGNWKPVQELLPQIADQFRRLPDDLSRDQISMDLFGKSGKDMIPFLDLGSKGMADLAAEADKLGVTLSTSNVADIHQAVVAHREFEAALEGIKLKIGTAVLPALTAMSLWFVTHQQDIENFAGGVRDQLVTAFTHLQNAVVPLMNALDPFVKFAQNNPKDMQAIAVALGVTTVAMLAFAAASLAASLVNPFTAVILGATLTIAAVVLVQRHWDEVWGEMQAAPQQLVEWLQSHWTDVLITIVAGPLPEIINHWGDIWSRMPGPVQSAMNDVAHIVEVVINGILAAFESMVNGIGAGIQAIRDHAGGFGGKTLLDSVGLSSDLSTSMRNFNAGSVSLQQSSDGYATRGETAADQHASAVNAALDSIAKWNKAVADGTPLLDTLTNTISGGGGGGGGGAGSSLTGAATQAEQGLTALAAAFAAWHAQTGGSIAAFQDYLGAQKLLEQSQQQATATATQAREELIALSIVLGKAGVSAAAFQAELGLKGLADAFVKFKGTTDEWIASLNTAAPPSGGIGRGASGQKSISDGILGGMVTVGGPGTSDKDLRTGFQGGQNVKNYADTHGGSMGMAQQVTQHITIQNLHLQGDLGAGLAALTQATGA